jgi:hypothetical protein
MRDGALAAQSGKPLFSNTGTLTTDQFCVQGYQQRERITKTSNGY